MPKLPSVKPKEVIRMLNQLGYVEVRQTGSHKQFKKPEGGKLITVAFHNKDINQVTLRSIIRQANLTVEEFIKLI
ncbi:MAG: type II toxin-antitoxin system HicA family toxin [Ignavibacteria bacterium]|nr:type II toxin-antitoxin system HicA family toxin [Ignavibacteria bacterium]